MIFSGLLAAIMGRAGRLLKNIFPHRIALLVRNPYKQKTLSSPVSFKYGV